MGLSPSRRTDKIVDPSAPVVHQQNTPIAAPINTTDPDHSAWGPRLSHRFTLLCQGLRYLKPQREHHLRPAVTELTTAPCPPAQVLQHPWSLCTFLSTQTKRNSTIAMSLKSDASKKGTAPVAPPSLVQKWTEFSPETHKQHGRGVHHNDTATIATNRSCR